VVLGVMAARLGVMFFGVAGVAMRAVGVVRGLFVIAGFVMLGGLPMVLRSKFVMLGRLVVVMLNACLVAHVSLPVCSC
jgi:hypothetical protein